MLKRMIVMLLAVSVVAASCGDDDSATTTTEGAGLTADEQVVADAIAASITAEPEAGNPFADPAAARCFAEGLVQDLGTTRLTQIGITTSLGSAEEAFAALDETEIGAVADRALGCIDVAAAMVPLFAVDGISEASALCMARGFEDTDFYREAFIAGMTGDDTFDPTADPEFLTLMMTTATECLTPDELSLFVGG